MFEVLELAEAVLAQVKQASKGTVMQAASLADPTAQTSLVVQPTLVYPEASREAGESGTVVVRVTIAPNGEVFEATVGRSSGFQRLDEAALRAVQEMRFEPYMKNGVASPALADIPFNFVLD